MDHIIKPSHISDKYAFFDIPYPLTQEQYKNSYLSFTITVPKNVIISQEQIINMIKWDIRKS